jgi:hypothetical protein
LSRREPRLSGCGEYGIFIGADGHLLGLTVGTGSPKITAMLHPQRPERFVDAAIGAIVRGLHAGAR